METFLLNFPDISPVSLFTALGAVLLVAILHWMKDKGLPPGPIGLPFFGYFPFLDNKQFHLQFHHLAKKYGNVFSLSVTGQLYISLNTLKVLREAFVSKADCFSNRMARFNIVKYCFDKGILYDSGEKWKVLRKFFVQNLKEYGLTSFKGSMADPIQDSLSAAIAEIRNLNGKPFNCTTLFTKCCTTSMRQLVFSNDQVTKEEIDVLMEAYVSVVKPFEGKLILLSGPLSEHVLLPLSPIYREMVSGKKTMDKILLKIIKEHESTLNEDNPRDIIDCYVRERKIRARNKDPTASFFTDEGLVGSLIQFVGDGALSVGYFIALFIHTLSKHPEVQEKIYSEILEVVGPDRHPTGEDRSRLPLTNSAILEMIRCSDFLRIVVSLECTKETTLNGYRIPKGSVVIVNNYSIMNDPKLYEDPHTFDPERYIVKPNKPKTESPTIFGVGKRACAGEYFVMTQVFLFLVTIVKSFKLSQPPQKEMENFLDIRICAEPRKNIERE